MVSTPFRPYRRYQFNSRAPGYLLHGNRKHGSFWRRLSYELRAGPGMAKHPKAAGLLTHEQIWSALDRLAERAGLSPSGLARNSRLDPTTFNKSKRITADG